MSRQRSLPIRVDLRSKFDNTAFYMELSEDTSGNYGISFFDVETRTSIDLTTEETESFFSIVQNLSEIYQMATNVVESEDD